MVSFLMVDYLRLELPGYGPPVPESLAVYPGNNRVLVSWPAVPGATSYNILRSITPATPAGGYATIATDVIGPVCGSGSGRATFIDTTAVNGTLYSYTVQASNGNEHSFNAEPSGDVTPSAKLSANAPAAPTKLTVTHSGHHEVALTWNASPDANYYNVWRTTLHTDGVGGTYPLRTILIADAITKTSFTDNSPSDGRIYAYHVTATNAAGSSEPSATARAVPLPPPPTTAPASITGAWKKTRNGDAITLSWSPVPGATGYVIYRSTGAAAEFKWPANFLTALVETTYTDQGNTEKNAKVKRLDNTSDYSYQVTAVNAGGISPPTTVRVVAH